MSTFFINIDAETLKPALESFIISLNRDFEELINREISFVKQCYMSGSKVWWRQYFQIGVHLPNDAEIRAWILTNQRPAILRGFNPRVLKLVKTHLNHRSEEIQANLDYARKLIMRCETEETIAVDLKIAKKINFKEM